TDAQGAFRFEGVQTGSNWIALATVEYAAVEYQGHPLDLSVGTDFNSDITVYETTTDDAALKVERSHLIVEMGIGQLEVTELIILNNTGDRTYAGNEEVVPNRTATARLALPAGATDVSFSSEEVAGAMVRTGQGFVDTRPVIPGQQQYVLSYALPCEASRYNLVKPIIYPTAAIDVLVDAPGSQVNASGLERLGTRQAEGRAYQHLGGSAIAAGADITISFGGLGQPSAAQAARASSTVVAAGHAPWWLNLVPLLAAVALVPMLAVYLRRPRAGPWPLPQRQTTSAVAMQREQLLVALAELDERYEASQLEEGAYRKQRQAVKDELTNLMLSPQGRESDAGQDRNARDNRPRKEVRACGGASRRRPQAG
ncbi:MAG TPA: hypothetical protein PLJ35_17580, partial [Anaerolineae bacterium]|nr:hypothetical protein [Anaerolineae bacterium]